MPLVVPPLPAVYTPSSRRMVFLLLGSLAFVLAGIVAVRRNPAVGYAGIAFFGLGVLIATVNLLPGSAFLQVTNEGFTFCSLYRRHHIPWREVKEFVLIHAGNRPMVGWNYNAERNGKARLRRLSAAITGAEAGLPDTYGMPASELATLLNTLLQRSRPGRLGRS